MLPIHTNHCKLCVLVYFVGKTYGLEMVENRKQLIEVGCYLNFNYLIHHWPYVFIPHIICFVIFEKKIFKLFVKYFKANLNPRHTFHKLQFFFLLEGFFGENSKIFYLLLFNTHSPLSKI